MYDFSSSDDDSGGLVMGGEDRVTSLAASLPSISSFNNYQNKQNKKRESKDTSSKLAGMPNNPSPKKAPANVKTPKSLKVSKPPKVPKATKAPKVTKPPKVSKPSKAVPKAPKPPKESKAPKTTKAPAKLPKNVSTSPKSPKIPKSPKKIKAEPKGALKLRLSIGGSTPSIENNNPGDLASIIDFVATGGGGLDGLTEVEHPHQQQLPPVQQQQQQQQQQHSQQQQPQQKQQKGKKSRSPAKRPAEIAPPAAGVRAPGTPKKPRKKRPGASEAEVDAQATAVQAAATARAAALADEVIAAVAAEVEVEGAMSDEDADPSMADPHRLTVVIPGENEEEIDAITGSPQHEQDAIQGMLSMSGTFSFAGVDGASDEMRRSRTAGNLERLKARLAAKRGLPPAGGAGQPGGRDAAGGVMGHQRDEEDEFERALRNCRQDDDYIYLGIDANDDDWKSIKKRGKAPGGRVPPGGTDQTWNPKGVSLKNVNKGEQRPQREGVKREVMESTLAESTKYEPAIASTPDKVAKMPKVKGTPREKEPAKVKPKKEVVHKISTEPKVRRPGKKGMATAKQRLGKILKIHRMYH